ncbi:MAG: DUF4367 domain-containing protein [Lachnospiraceae bacterium]
MRTIQNFGGKIMMKNMVIRMFGVALAGTMVLSGTACAKQGTKAAAAESAATESSVQLPNPWTEYDTLEEAEKAAGFTITVPDVPAGYTSVVYRVMDGLLELQYQDADGNRLILRKGDTATLGEEETDISGDYTQYDAEETKEISGKEVTEKGDGTSVYCAVWTDGDYAYSIVCDQGLSDDDAKTIIAGLS